MDGGGSVGRWMDGWTRVGFEMTMNQFIQAHGKAFRRSIMTLKSLQRFGLFCRSLQLSFELKYVERVKQLMSFLFKDN